MATWDISETHSLVQVVFGRKQLELVRPCIRSVIDRQAFARYHLQEARALLQRFQRRHLTDGASLIDITLGTNASGQMAFQRFIVKASAHVTAGVQSVHAIPDILASAMYYSSGINLGASAIPERHIAFKGVIARLVADRRFRQVASVLERIPLIPQFQHLGEVANLSKHSSVVRCSVNEDWTGRRACLHELHLSSFDREGNQFPESEVFSLVAPVYEGISECVVDAGRQLNAALQEIASKAPAH